TRMQHGSREQFRIHRFYTVYEPPAYIAKFFENFIARVRVVIRFVRFAILQISCREYRAACQIVIDTRNPQRFKVQQMSSVLLSGPLLLRLLSQKVASAASKNFFQSRRSSSQPRTQIRMQLHQKREVELTFKPDWYSIHGRSRQPIGMMLESL